MLELPFFYERIDFARHARYMSASGWHWQPLINGYSDHIPPEFRDLAPRLHGFPSGDSFLLLRAPAGPLRRHPPATSTATAIATG